MTVGALAAAAAPAHALDPARALTQLHHTAWRVEDGAPPDVWSLAQTPDGFLWLGTGAGLYRFDGTRFEKPALSGDAGPGDITALLAQPDGDLWIGGFDGSVARLHAGRLERVRSGLRSGIVFNLAADPTGAVWAAFGGEGARPGEGGLARFDGVRWTPAGAEWGLPAADRGSLAAAPDGVLWAALDEDVWFLRPGARHFERTSARVTRDAQFAFTREDGLLVSDRSGVRRLSRTALMRGAASAAARRILSGHLRRLMVDRDGSVWGSPSVGGLLRARLDGGDPHGLPQAVSMRDGLTADLAVPVLEDREGDVWVGTNLGLDRFRAADVVSLDAVPVTSRDGYAGAADARGAVVIKDSGALYRVTPELGTTVLARQDSPPLGACAVGAEVWAATKAELLKVVGSRVEHVPGPPGWREQGRGCAVDSAGRLVVFLGTGRLFRWDGAWRSLVLPPHLPTDVLRWVAPAPEGGLWLGFGSDAVVLVRQGRPARLEGWGRTGLGRIDLVVADGPDLLVGAENGLGRRHAGAFQALRPDQLPGLERVTGLARAPDGELWASGINGAYRIAAPELTRAFADPNYRPRFQRLDSRDGLPGRAQQDSHQNTAFATGGRVWLLTSHGVAWAEPQRFVRNPLPPPVIIRSLAAGERQADFPTELTLPTGARNVQIDYTATSLSAPERVRFRYRLDGVDAGWVDPGARRQAFYTKLPPGRYLFRVIAANSSGVWNRQGATVRFTVPPRWFETPTFFVLTGLLAAGLLWVLYVARIRRMSARMRGLLEERAAERERIARELHDTLLQGFQGLMLRFRAVASASPLGGPASTLLDEALHRAEQVLAEGRDSVRDLRLAGRAGLEATLAEAAQAAGGGVDVDFRLAVEGVRRPLHPLVAEECRRVGEEALANAFRHARARNIEARVSYGARSLRLRVRDDGLGLPPDRLGEGADDRHFGLMGMRERARRIQGGLLITSAVGTGVSVELTVPARVAYDTRRRESERARRPALHEA